MHMFEFREEKSAKFWSIELQGKSFTVRFGKIGTTGQTQTKKFADEASAKKEYDKLVAEKVKKGYVEVGAAAAAPTGTAKAPRAAEGPKAATKAAASKKGARAAAPPPPPVPPPAPPSRHIPAGPATTGSSVLDCLLAAVRAEPDDDAPRLVLSDWLEEHGDQARAEFIRVQCQMTRAAAAWGRNESPTWNRFDQQGREVADLDPEYAALHARARALVAEHGARWAEDLPAPVADAEKWPRVGTWTVFDRGFMTFYVKWVMAQPDPHETLDGLLDASRKPAFAWVSRIVLDLAGRSDGDEWFEDWREGLARHPAIALVTDIDFSWAMQPLETALPDLASAGPLPRLRCLKIVDENDGGEADQFHQLRNLPGLRDLTINWASLADFEAWPPFPELRRLNVSRSGVRGIDLVRLAESDRFLRLEAIDVSLCRVTPDGILALIASDRRPGLAEVRFVNEQDPSLLREGFAAAEFIRRLADLPQAARLQRLRLYHLALTDADVEPLLASPHLAGLGYLDVRRNRLSAKAVLRLRERFPRVEGEGGIEGVTDAIPSGNQTVPAAPPESDEKCERVLNYHNYKSKRGSHKYWQITLEGATITIYSGKHATPGKKETKTFLDAVSARKEYDRLLKKMRSKGYR
jgi:uncharacterized protein (TIGR02996 family)